MKMSRRNLLAGGAAAGLSMAVPETARSREKPGKPEACLRISSQEGRLPGKSLEEKLDLMEKWGIEGLEVNGGAVNDVEKYLKAIDGRKVRISAICFGSMKGAFVSEDEEKRKSGAQQLKDALQAAGELKCNGVIYVPAFNGQTRLSHQEIRKVLVQDLPAIGEHALKHNTHVILEPLNRREAYFLRQVADAAAIARDCKCEGIAVMGDFYHMGIEEPNDMGAFISARDVLKHVHLASRTRKMPGQDERSFIDGFRALKMIGYREFCSFECGCKGDRMVEIPKSVEFLRKQWEEAGV